MENQIGSIAVEIDTVEDFHVYFEGGIKYSKDKAEGIILESFLFHEQISKQR
jgi:hypothetical protein